MREINIEVDSYKQVYNYKECMQNDDVTLKLTLMQNGVVYNLTGCTLALNWVKADNTIVAIGANLITFTGNVVTVQLPRDCTRAVGLTRFELVVINSTSKQETTFPLSLEIVGSVIDGQEVSANTATLIEGLNDANAAATITYNELNKAISQGNIASMENRIDDLETNDASQDTDIYNLQNNLSSTNFTVSQKANKTYVDTQIQAIASGSPKAAFPSFAALQADATANTTEGRKYIYLVTADGKWYYWNGTAWTVGNVYQSTGIADGSVSTAKTTTLVGQGFLATTEPVNLNFTTKQVEIKAGAKYIFYKNKVITLPATEILVDKISTATELQGALYYNTADGTFAMGAMVNLTETCIMLGFIYRNAQDLNFNYTINGKAPLPITSITREMLDFSVPEPGAVESKWKGKNFVTFGDSITWYDGKVYNSANKEEGIVAKGYQSYMREKLLCTVDNKGASGFDMTQIRTIINAYSYINTDAVTITSGANDHRKGIPIGTILPIESVFATTTYVGALQSSIEKILNSKPNIKIYLLCPIRGWFNEQGTTNVPNPSAIGVLSEDYVNAMKEVAKLYGIPVLDLYNLTCINNLTRSLYIGDKDTQPYYLHPSTVGYERIKDLLIPFLNNN